MNYLFNDLLKNDYIEKSITDTAILYDISMISGIDDLQQIIQLIINRATMTLCNEMAAVALIDANGGLKTYFSSGILPRQLDQVLESKFKATVDQLIGSKGSSYVMLHSVSADTRIVSTQYQCLLFKPLRTHEKIVGLLVAGRLWKDTYSEDELRLYTILAQKASFSIENIKLHGVLLEQNVTDPLTRLYNLRYLEIQLPLLLDAGKNDRKTVLFAVMDLMNFKLINDTFGHEFGDYVLVEFAGYLKQIFRKDDICSRVGGDEFLMVFYDYPSEKTGRLRENIKGFLNEPGIKKIKDDKINFDINIGFSCYPTDGSDYDTLFKVADLRMYKDKKRNKI
jgi:diguanylate cyclase (GGDEF)-like protein